MEDMDRGGDRGQRWRIGDRGEGGRTGDGDRGHGWRKGTGDGGYRRRDTDEG